MNIRLTQKHWIGTQKNFNLGGFHHPKFQLMRRFSLGWFYVDWLI